MEATSLVTALAPAFAAGFAVQRLLEILDPLAETVAGPEKKKIVLGLSSLIAGLGFAGGVGLRVLVHLGAYTFGSRFDRNDLIDLFVTGLVISAGTEGFNSILKFMNYKKEDQKAEANTKAITAASTQALFERRLKMLEPTGNLAADLATALKSEIKSRWPDQFIHDGWDERTFDAYVTDGDIFKMQDAATEASDTVARAYQVELSDEARLRIQSRVTLSSTPKKLLPVMENEVASA